ncbi:helix-turn-helix transcriptional regulator [Bradyrhizobium sp.]|uniref:AraC family transcriptional regulator n=1 Tax=Bradyrhizobium sp. TaxID=376 RepID=UPI003C4EC76B
MTVTPHRAVTRNGVMWRGMGVELVQAMTHQRIDYDFYAKLHLLVAYQQGIRRDGDSHIEGLPRSTRRDVAKRLTLVPAGRQFHEWHDPRIPTCATYFYFDPTELRIDSDNGAAGAVFAPRLFFEDAAIWNTMEKLRQAVCSPQGVNRLFAEALGTVLLHELARLEGGTEPCATAAKGGLAAWQQRIVMAYIEEHLSEQVPLAALARLARLSTFHFCRAFKQSFGVPPHRYHTIRRIERAKGMLAERKHSVTEIGLTVGFSETSSFTAVFRKITGQTPSRYHRALG